MKSSKWVVLLFFVMTLLLNPTNDKAHAAKYPSTESEFYQYLMDIGKRTVSTNGYRANFKTYQQYNLIVYGDRYGTFRTGSYCGNLAEYRYLGYSDYGKEVSNMCFINDATGSGPDDWKFIKVDPNEDSWGKIRDPDQYKYTNDIDLIGHNAKNLNVHGLGGRPYGKVLTAPTWKSQGSIYTEHRNSNGSVWYATFIVPPMNHESSISTNISTDSDTYVIKSTENKVDGQMTVTSSANITGYAKKSHIKSLTAEYKGNETTGKAVDRVWHRQSITFSRNDFSKPGTFKVNLEAKGTLETIFADKDLAVATKPITVIVEPYLQPKLAVEASASPERQEITGDKANITVTVKGSIKDAGGDIESWTIFAKKEEDGKYLSKTIKSSKTSESATFTFTVPKEKISGPGGTVKQIFDTMVRVSRKGEDQEGKDRTHAYVSIPNAPEIPPPTTPPAPDNQPPVASVFVNSEYFWPETVTAQDNSYDTDGKIVDSQFSFDGVPSQSSKKYSRVTEPESHNVSIKVTDDAGAEDQDTKQFRILPTIPTADFSISGTKKENRAINLDAILSENSTPSIRVAPLVYEKTQWQIKPLTDGTTHDDVKIKSSNDKRKLDFLVRKSGDYEVTLIVENIFGEQSKPVSKVITVVKDLEPEARFSLDTRKVIRDKNTKNATIQLHDDSISLDDDIINQRLWYVEFDSNNDGVIGTAQDQPKQLIDNGNNRTITFETNKVGNYRFSLQVKEKFGQPTIPEFIQDIHYMRDTSDILHPRGTVSFYHETNNFNKPLTDKMVVVDNVSPIIDFGIKRKNKVDIVLNFGGLDIATRQHQTGAAPGGGQYDHYYYTVDQTQRNKMVSLAADLETNLLQKGLDAKVTLNHDYYRVYDSDGTCIRNIPQYGWSTYTSYEYDTVTTTSSSYSPPSGWQVMSSSSAPGPKEYTTGTATWDNGMNFNDGPYLVPGWRKTGMTCDARDPKDNGCIHYTIYWEKNTTIYTYNLRKDNSYQVWEIQYYYNQGCNSQDEVNTTDFTQSYANQSYRSDAFNHFIRMDSTPWNWMGDNTKVNSVNSKSKSSDVYLWDFGSPTNKLNTEKVVLTGSGKGNFTPFDAVFLNKNTTDIENFFLNQYVLKEKAESFTILMGDKVNYNVTYDDHESDPEIKREWKFTHDPTEINKRTIDNQGSEISESKQWINTPIQFNQPGTFNVQLHSLDDPIHWKDPQFFNFRKWSDQEIQRDFFVNVHRRPVANFSFTLDAVNNLSLDPLSSYDPDHQFNRTDKGIVDYRWVSYTVDGNKYPGKPPTTLLSNKVYDVTLEVEDIDGATGTVTKRISSRTVNEKPVALFTVQDTVARSEKLNFVDLSYDPNGDALTNYNITVRKQGESTILKTMGSWPNSFKDMNLSEGSYTVGLEVWDIPKNPPSLKSDLFERQIKVMRDNNPPVSQFTLSPNPVELGKITTYKDSSTDPDGHYPLKYSWKIDKVDNNGTILETWNTGVAPTDFRDFGGIGKYKVYQTVWDTPPYPLNSLSDTSVQDIEVIKGPDHPFPLFTWHPEEIYATKSFTLDPVNSFDLDGTVEKYEWKITDPKGNLTNSTTMFPKINNATEGDYKVELHVVDNDGLRSLVPSIRTINVLALPPNQPPVANFVWEPTSPFLGKKIEFNPDSSYDPSIDGRIVSWQWEFTSAEGTKTTSNERYPSIIAASKSYQVKLTVTDNEGATGDITQLVNVNIANLEALVTHTPEWKKIWQEKGESPDVNIFRAGEKFIIELKSTPANRVWGSVDFGGEVGKISIPSDAFTLVKNEQFEMLWRAELWREDFKLIEEGEYQFNFKSLHPVNNPIVEAEDFYLIKIEGNVFGELGFHRNY
jgi:hypothetical protein